MICRECETVSHCSKNGCIPKNDDAPVTPDGIESVAIYIITGLSIIFGACFGAWLYAQVWPILASL